MEKPVCWTTGCISNDGRGHCTDPNEWRDCIPRRTEKLIA